MTLSSRYLDHWPETRERFLRWWRREPTDRPLLRITAPRDKPLDTSPAPPELPPPRKYLDAEYRIGRWRHYFNTTWFGGDAFPMCMADLGPGSLALYLGAKPGFDASTIWFEPAVSSLGTDPLPDFDADNHWFRTHTELLRRVHEAFGDDAYTAIPDLVESTDIVAALRGSEPFLYDLMDRPADCHRWLQRVAELYPRYYNAFYDLLKDSHGGSVFTVFALWSPGRTAKIQCDFAAMLSPEMFREFYLPYARQQLEALDYALYHLDGPQCLVHVDALLTLDRLTCIQWVPGAGQPPQHEECWFPLYRKILDGGKGLQLSLKAEKVTDFVKRFGARGLYIITSTRTEAAGRELLEGVNALGKRH